jgi:PhoPQ-activated pathogenicity-related protein
MFQRLSDGRYAVQNQDFYQIDSEDVYLNQMKIEKIILFIEQNIDKRCIFKNTIDEAIQAFNDSFEKGK